MALTASRPFIIPDAELENLRTTFLREYVFHSSSPIFNSPYGAGYWMFGVSYFPNKGWLVFEFDDTVNYRSDEATKLHDAAEKYAKHALDENRPLVGLPKNYYFIGEEVGRKIFENGVQKWGRNWLEKKDLGDIDNLIQWTLLGEIRYG